MTYQTHKAGGSVLMLFGWLWLDMNNLLDHTLHPLLQLVIMYPAASWGSMFPDLDHHWNSVKEKTPINRYVNKIILKLGSKHRSWQTHSILVTGGFCFLLFSFVRMTVLFEGTLGAMDLTIIRLLITGFSLGVASHLLLDAITPSGIHIIPNFKVRFVPRKHFFATDGPWEGFILKVLLVAFIYAALNILGIWEHILYYVEVIKTTIR